MSYQPDLANLIGRSLDSIASITCTVDGDNSLYVSVKWTRSSYGPAVLKPLSLQMKVAPLARH
jgi:hypothetical protein